MQSRWLEHQTMIQTVTQTVKTCEVIKIFKGDLYHIVQGAPDLYLEWMRLLNWTFVNIGQNVPKYNEVFPEVIITCSNYIHIQKS